MFLRFQHENLASRQCKNDRRPKFHGFGAAPLTVQRGWSLSRSVDRHCHQFLAGKSRRPELQHPSDLRVSCQVRCHRRQRGALRRFDLDLRHSLPKSVCHHASPGPVPTVFRRRTNGPRCWTKPLPYRRPRLAPEQGPAFQSRCSVPDQQCSRPPDDRFGLPERRSVACRPQVQVPPHQPATAIADLNRFPNSIAERPCCLRRE